VTRFFFPPLHTRVAPNAARIVTFDAAGSYHIEEVPHGITVRNWDYENQQTRVANPHGSRVTMAYSADFRRVSKES
jgi:hypothetical protein